jgi:NADH:ubiquinone oxidoreductase subunit H
MYLAVVSIAIIVSFHFRSQPTGLERRLALPLGVIFWVLSLTCLVNGFGNYIRTVVKYSRKAALVQSGWRTQLTFTVVGVVIFACCILFIVTGAEARR